MLELAERAAAADDLAFADELLRGAARIQEAELGPLHPDLANTLNNLAIVAEKTGRLDDAETFYRRAVAIVSASLPVGHPMIVASRENLEDFCRARGLPIRYARARDSCGTGEWTRPLQWMLMSQLSIPGSPWTPGRHRPDCRGPFLPQELGRLLRHTSQLLVGSRPRSRRPRLAWSWFLWPSRSS